MNEYTLLILAKCQYREGEYRSQVVAVWKVPAKMTEGQYPPTAAPSKLD